MIRSCFAVMLALCSFTALGQAYPSKAIRIVVPQPVGGAVDSSARVLASRMSESMAQPIVVENRPGSGGQIGVDLVAKSAPDGYTLVVSSPGSLTVGPHLGHVPYDPLRDLAAVGLIATTPSSLGVNAALPIRSFRELVEYAKARPGQLNYAHTGTGSLLHLGGELIQMLTGIKVTAVAYKGGAPAAAAIASGEVQYGLTDYTSMKPLADGGRIRMLALVDANRSAFAPDLPTVGETLPGFEAGGWMMLLAPGATPNAIIGRLDNELSRALKDPDLQAQFRKAALEPAYMGAGETSKFLRAGFERWGKVIKDAGIKLE